MSTATGRRATQSVSCTDQVEVADIIRIYGQRYRDNHRLPLSHLKVMRAIESCRTAALGGHVEKCDHCGLERISYNSCRNRHCPKCQAMAKAAWLQQRKAELLPVGYFHNVFTLPHELNPLALANKKLSSICCSNRWRTRCRNLRQTPNMVWAGSWALQPFCTHGTRSFSATFICIA